MIRRVQIASNCSRGQSFKRKPVALGQHLQQRALEDAVRGAAATSQIGTSSLLAHPADRAPARISL
jgi:hypothetical protein